MNITRISEDFVKERPFIRSSLKKGLINYSALARMIAKENKLDLRKNFDAILIALRRYKAKIKEEKEEKISEKVKKGKLEVKTKGDNAEILLRFEKESDISALCSYVYSLLSEYGVKLISAENNNSRVKLVTGKQDLSRVIKVFSL